jgi:hypothetical protein
MLYWPSFVLGFCVIALALLAFYVPTIYIRKTNKLIHLLEEIAGNTRK